MTDVVVVQRQEHVIDDKRLGRHVEHDPRSKDHPFGVTVAPMKSVAHRRYGGVFDQGNLGSCTGNAAAGAVNTMPLRNKAKVPVLKEPDAVKLYETATSLDNIPGTFPPDDTGSSGLAVAKACVRFGYILAYKHAFSIDEALAALQVGPVITGVDWYEGFDHPDANGLVKIAGQIRGGHEFEVTGFVLAPVLDDSLVICENSWGASWGKSGKFSFTVATWKQLLANQGDVTILIR